jgi:hypothetical protein
VEDLQVQLTGPVGYRDVDDIHKSLQSLLDAGAQAQQEARTSVEAG